MKKIFLISLVFIFAGHSIFSQKTPLDYVSFKKMSDLDFGVFDKKEYSQYYNKKYDTSYFLENFYKAWNTEENVISKEEWVEFFTYLDISRNSPCFSGSYQKYSKDFIFELTNNIPANKNDYPHYVKKAILIETADLRGLPTNEFCLRNMRNAGEGYPFDYLQYTSIWIGTPVLILSKTKDGLWYFVSTPNNKGWISADKIAFVSDKQIEEIKSIPLGAITKDNLIVKKDWNSVRLHIGTLLPIITKENSTHVLIPFKSFKDNSLFFESFEIQSNIQQFPIVFNASNVEKILSDILNGKYSWGGIDGGRDCSSTIKDYLTPFGIWLPRNASQQHKNGRMINLKGNNKEATIITEGIPFLSSLYKPGHIMLYVGLDKKTKSKPLQYQTLWGIKAYYTDDANLHKFSLQREKYGLFGISRGDLYTNNVQARFIVGRTVITEIEPIKNYKDIKGLKVVSFIDNLNTLTILPDKN